MKKPLLFLATLLCSCTTTPKDVSAELQEELSDVPLTTTGQIPTWLLGTLVRNGPINVTVDGKTNSHWFDGLAMLHAFSFKEGAVHYSNRFLRTDAYTEVFEKGSLNYRGFAQDPCRSLFRRFFTRLFPSSSFPLQNANVNVAKIAGEYVALTETPLPVRFDISTLKTLGVLDYADSLPHKECWESAHPHCDVALEEQINYLVDYGRLSHYVLYHFKQNSSERNVIARVPVKKPSYMHSFALTENYVIFTEFPFVINPLDLLTKGLPFIQNFKWEPSLGTQFTVVNRHDGTLVGKYPYAPFFAFHHANAFEEDGRLHIDIVCYDNARVITGIAKHFRQGFEEAEFPTRLNRFTLDLESGQLLCDTISDRSMEFPRVNEAFDGKPYRYVYTTDARSPVSSADVRPLYKIDMQTKEVLQWEEPGCYPGEPVFVAAPGAESEDDGVVLAVILDPAHHTSFLLVLDAKTFTEIGKAMAPHVIPEGLHGQYF